ncbi:Sorting nexin, cytoplasm-to-vacuole targeting pathway/endosomal sorting [Saitoella coloradoensis]
MSYEDNNPFSSSPSEDNRPSSFHPYYYASGSTSREEQEQEQEEQTTGSPSFGEDGDEEVPAEYSGAVSIGDRREATQSSKPPSMHDESDEDVLKAKDPSSCCRIGQILASINTQNGGITITEAAKSSEGNFVVYTISLTSSSKSGGNYTWGQSNLIPVRRRYSDFASLHKFLCRLFPTCIIPPIPEKQSAGAYVAHPTKAKEDVTVIEYRKRALTVFLRKCAMHPHLRASHFFHRFLENDVSWSEINHTPPLNTLPKSLFHAPPINPSSPTPAHAHLPAPSSSSILTARQNPAGYPDLDARLKEFERTLAPTMEKTCRRLVRRLADLSAEYAELGATYNGFSLTSTTLPTLLERCGQASDHTYLAVAALAQSIATGFGESLVERRGSVEAVRDVLKFRAGKEAQYIATKEALQKAKETLEHLEKSELEAKRIDGMLSRIQGPSTTSSPTSPDNDIPAPEDVAISPPTERKKRSGSSGMGMSAVLGKLNHAFQGILDQDPSTTRRNQIGKTREMIVQLTSGVEVAERDRRVCDESVKREVERYFGSLNTTAEGEGEIEGESGEGRENVGAGGVSGAALRDMMSGWAGAMTEFGRRGVEGWQDVLAEIGE